MNAFRGKGIEEAAGQKEHSMLSFVVVGASGDLAKKKIFPSLFALYYENLLPQVVKQLLWCV